MPNRLKKYKEVEDWRPLRARERWIITTIAVMLLILIITGLTMAVNSTGNGVTEIVVAIFGFVGVCVTAYFGYLQAVNSREALAQAEREMSFQSASLDFSTFLAEWGDTMKEIEKLMDETNIDRFLILRAWNGFLEPRWTTAVLQIRKGDQDLVSYVHFELDTDYVDRLREINRENRLVFDVADLPDDASIKKVYELEGITCAAWYQLLNQKLEGTESQAVTYCSFATHEGTIEETTITRCSIIAGRLKGVAHSFK